MSARQTVPECFRVYYGARNLVRSGAHVFLVMPGTKTPYANPKDVPDGEGGVHLASDDEFDLLIGFSEHPDADIAIACGPTGIVVLDADGPEGAESLAKLEAELGPLPTTLQARTGRDDGGKHYYFTVPDDVRIPNSTSKYGKKLDVKGRGGYAVAPPSSHKSGRRYEWINSEPIAPLPQVWIERLQKQPEAERPAVPEVTATKTDAKGWETIRRQCERVRNAPIGQQEITLGGAALILGGEAKLGHIVYDDGRAALITAGLEMKNAPDGEPWTVEGRKGIAGVVDRAMGRGQPIEQVPGWFSKLGESTAANDPKAKWIELGVSDIWAELEPINHLVPALDMAPGAPTIVGGYGFSGKTVAVQAMAVALAANRFVWGSLARRNGPQRVIHVDHEQGAHLTRDRYQRLAIGMGVTQAELEGRLTLVSMPTVYLDSPGTEAFYTEKFTGYDLAIIDSLHAACPSIEENDAGARRYLDMLTRVSLATGCVVLVIHHARKPAKDSAGGAKMALRGSGAIFDAASSVLIFDADEGEAPRVTHAKARNTGKPMAPFVLKITDRTPRDEDGSPFVGAGRMGLVVEHASAEVEKKARDDAHTEAANEAIRTALRARDYKSKDALMAASKLGTGRFRPAYATLVERGEIEESGTLRDRTISLKK